ncbi:DUF4393 domain-containing protein [Arthrobacter sp. ISL-48]|uniref:DUF4393 domain-containing protein n=1 Tax=Arthrobacter sp. ISL-48 TaxID=2819110 RepID=UPI001BE5308E|nr:DUF4393 domain-containing protein [Arthrobacter sp. ISL-48]MBT2531631.1 DUF4393 domain-containing protein [Arthrobacter sp. ISL-48]
MTGDPIIGAAGVIAGKIVKGAAQDIRETEQTINKELVAAAKETETFKQAANTRAKRIAVKEALFLQLFRPIRGLIGLSAEYFENNFDEDMRERIAAIPEKHRVAPKPIIAAPAMQGLAFSLDEPDLKKLYLDLLASASDDRQINRVHPSFVEIIRQLTGKEVELLEYPLGTGTSVPVARIRRKLTSPASGWSILRTHLLPLTDSETGLDAENELDATYVDNWIRLGLIEVTYGTFLTREGAYDWVENRPEFKQLQSLYTNESSAVEAEHGILRSTDFGSSFADAVGMRPASSRTTTESPTDSSE